MNKKVMLALIGVFILGVFLIIGFSLTGNVTAPGIVNLTVQTYNNVTFTTDSINWGSGAVTGEYAILITNGSVEGGNWSSVDSGFILENVGNVNVILNVSFGKNATSFIGGTNPEYQFKVTNSEAGSCSLAVDEGVWYNASTSSIRICDSFNYSESSDEIRIDLRLKIPIDSRGGSMSDTITLSQEAV